MLPRWQTVAERCPISTSPLGFLRLWMQSSQLRIWLSVLGTFFSSSTASSFGSEVTLPRSIVIRPFSPKKCPPKLGAFSTGSSTTPLA